MVNSNPLQQSTKEAKEENEEEKNWCSCNYLYNYYVYYEYVEYTVGYRTTRRKICLKRFKTAVLGSFEVFCLLMANNGMSVPSLH